MGRDLALQAMATTAGIRVATTPPDQNGRRASQGPALHSSAALISAIHCARKLVANRSRKVGQPPWPGAISTISTISSTVATTLPRMGRLQKSGIQPRDSARASGWVMLPRAGAGPTTG
jgi:hypothetical protein